jgi:hypothetical protein
MRGIELKGRMAKKSAYRANGSRNVFIIDFHDQVMYNC